MTIFYKSALTECETYEDFKNEIGNLRYRTIDDKREGFYDVEQYSKIFEGFDHQVTYSYMTENYSTFLYDVCISDLVFFTSPEFNVKNKTVTFFESEEKRSKGIRSNPTKMGKFFRKIAPYFNDKQIEFLVNYVVDYFTESVYEHHVAKGCEITKIYLSKPESGRIVGDCSCINASCMRHDNWQVHPTQVYATESWELHYLTNEDGDIAARVLVCREDDVYSFIYASCERAGDVLREKLEELGFIDVEDAHKPFDCAKLLKIEGNGGLVAPYIDYHCEVKDCEDHLEITYTYSDYSFSSTSGCVEILYSCEECGRECHEEDMITVDDCLYCQDCVYYCDHFDEYFVGESFEVFYSTYGSYNVCEDALKDMGAVYNEEENEWQTEEWFAECTAENEEDDEEDTETEPKKEIKVGDKCVVIGGYIPNHHFPIGTVVKVNKPVANGIWDCNSAELGFSQHIDAKDLVIVE